MTPPRHIVVINVHFGPDTYGGATIVAGQVARRLQAHGIRISAIAAMNAPGLMPYTVVRSHQDGIDTYRIALPQSVPQSLAHTDERAGRRILQVIERLAPDLVHLHCLQGLGVSFMQPIADAQVPMILSVHDFWWLCERQFMVRPDGSYCGQDPVEIANCAGCVPSLEKTEERQTQLFAAAALADLVTFPSAFAHGLSVRSGMPARQAVVWENGITPPGPDFFPTQAARRAQVPPLTFGFIGGPSSVKGWPVIRAAFQRVEPDDFLGVVVDGSLDGSWWRPGMLQGMRGRWQIHPRFEQGPEMDDFYAGIDVLLFMSQWREAFGLTVREAISRGIRVIQTAGGGAGEHRAPTRRVPIGAGPDALVNAIQTELAQHGSFAEPVPCRSYDEQAAELMTMIERL